MTLLNQREYDLAQIESEMRVGTLYQEWMAALLAGRNPLDQLASMSPEDVQNLPGAEPPQIIPPQE